MRLLLLLLPTLATLCRYTVRDVAFVDLGDESYRLELRVPAPDAETLGVVASALLDTNVRYEVNELEAPSALATLHHPDGRSLEVDLWSGGSLDVVKLNGVSASPLRDQLLDEVFTHYAFCLFVEGEDAEKNARAREVIDGAFTELGKIYDQMPKAVGERPRLTTLPHARRSDEQPVVPLRDIGEGGIGGGILHRHAPGVVHGWHVGAVPSVCRRAASPDDPPARPPQRRARPPLRAQHR